MKTSIVVLARPFVTTNACAGAGAPPPRTPYDMVLGGSRADSVKASLVGRGGQQVATASRGELDAKGTNESPWAEDRRVDVRLAN